MLASNASFNIGGTWNMRGGTNTISNNVASVIGSVSIGNANSNAAVNVYNNAIWNLNGMGLSIGAGSASSSNALLISGGVVSNVGSLTVGSAGNTVMSIGNSLTVSNGGTLIVTGSFFVGWNQYNASNVVNIGGLGAASTVSNGGAGHSSVTQAGRNGRAKLLLSRVL